MFRNILNWIVALFVSQSTPRVPFSGPYSVFIEDSGMTILWSRLDWDRAEKDFDSWHASLDKPEIYTPPGGVMIFGPCVDAS